MANTLDVCIRNTASQLQGESKPMSRQSIRFMIFTCAALIVAAGCAPQEQPTATPTPCPAPPIQEDIDAALNVFDGIFEPERWKQTQDEGQAIIHVLWLQQDGGGVAHQEY